MKLVLSQMPVIQLLNYFTSCSKAYIVYNNQTGTTLCIALNAKYSMTLQQLNNSHKKKKNLCLLRFLAVLIAK